MTVSPLDPSITPRPGYPGTLLEKILRTVATNPELAALRFIDDDGEVTTWSYQELWDRSTSIAHRLLAESMVPGDRVALIFSPGLEAVSALLGCQMARAVPVPTCYPRMRRPMPRLDSVVGDCDPAVLLSTAEVIDGIQGDHLSPASIALPRIAVDEIPVDRSKQISSVLASSIEAIDGDDLGLLQYTSGSTSEPKGVRVLHRNLFANLSAIAHGFQIGEAYDNPPLTGVFWLPFFHDMGLIGGIMTPLSTGGTVILMSPQTFLRRPIEWLRAISKYRANVSGGPNFAYQLAFDRIAPSKTSDLDLSCWKTAFCGAEPIDARTLGDFARRFSSCGFSADSFYPCYGLAESTLLAAGGDQPGPLHTVTFNRESIGIGDVTVAGPETEETERHRRTLVGCGHAVRQTEISIVDPTSKSELSEDRVGEIWIRGGSVADGYWNRTDDTTFGCVSSDGRDGWMRTGDLGFFHDKKLFVTGRLKDTLIIRGRNISPQDIEGTVRLACGKNVATTAAFSVAGVRGEAVGLAVEVDRHLDATQYPEIVREIRRRVIEVHEVDPFHIVLVRIGSLPITTSGKIRRSECRDLFQKDELKIVHRFDAPQMVSQTPLAMPELRSGDHSDDPEAIADQVAQWIGQWMIVRGGVDPKEIEPAKPLVDYGLDSMMAIELSGEIETWASVTLSPLAAWDYPTIADLSRYITSQILGTTPPPPTTVTGGV